jgi:hypothetical protein
MKFRMQSEAILLSNGVSEKKVYIGFAWTVALFGLIALLIRKNWFHAMAVAVYLGIAILRDTPMWLDFGVFLCIAFSVNKANFKYWLGKGYYITKLPNGVSLQEIDEALGTKVQHRL